jgi:acyl carrier protein
MSREAELKSLVEEFGVVEEDGRLTLDSFAVINVVEALEDRFGVRLTAREVTRESFATLPALLALLEEKLA